MNYFLFYMADIRLLLFGFLAAFMGYLYVGPDGAHPYIVLGIALLLIIWSIYAIGMSIYWLKKFPKEKRKHITGIIFCIFVISIVTVFAREPFTFLQYQPMLNALAPACVGQAFPENPAFQSGQQNTLVAIDTESTSGKWSTYAILAGWTPNNANQVALAACISESDPVIDTCYYTGATVKRHQSQVYVTLVEVKTGQTLARQVFSGGEPKDCAASVSSSGEIHGTDVDWSTVANWLSDYVNP